MGMVPSMNASEAKANYFAASVVTVERRPAALAMLLLRLVLVVVRGQAVYEHYRCDIQELMEVYNHAPSGGL